MQLVDSDFYTRSDIDLLIGSDLFPTIMKSGIQHILWGLLLGQETVFGWILSGPVFNISSHSTTIALEAEQPYKFTSTLSLWEAEQLSKKPTTSTFQLTAKSMHMEELSKKPTTSKSTSKSIHNGMQVVIRICTRSPNEWKMRIVVKIVTCREALTRITDVRSSHGLIQSAVSELLIVFFD